MESASVHRSGLDRRFYELCALSELKNALRSGDIWVQGSRQFKDFDEYLVPSERFSALQRSKPVIAGCGHRLRSVSQGPAVPSSNSSLTTVDRMAQSNELPDAIITVSGPEDHAARNAVPEEADALIRQAYGLLPHVKITELLLEVDDWTGLHPALHAPQEPAKWQRINDSAADRDSGRRDQPRADQNGRSPAPARPTRNWPGCKPGTSATRPTRLRLPNWSMPNSATLSPPLGRRHHVLLGWPALPAGGRGEAAGQINAHYGGDPGVLFYTHVSDQYAPFHTQVINATVRDATYVLDGLLYHESDLRIEEHYTDTAGFTDHVFALMHLLGFRFAPRIRDLTDTPFVRAQATSTTPPWLV